MNSRYRRFFSSFCFMCWAVLSVHDGCLERCKHIPCVYLVLSAGFWHVMPETPCTGYATLYLVLIFMFTYKIMIWYLIHCKFFFQIKTFPMLQPWLSRPLPPCSKCRSPTASTRGPWGNRSPQNWKTKNTMSDESSTPSQPGGHVTSANSEWRSWLYTHADCRRKRFLWRRNKEWRYKEYGTCASFAVKNQTRCSVRFTCGRTMQLTCSLLKMTVGHAHHQLQCRVFVLECLYQVQSLWDIRFYLRPYKPQCNWVSVTTCGLFQCFSCHH